MGLGVPCLVSLDLEVHLPRSPNLRRAWSRGWGLGEWREQIGPVGWEVNGRVFPWGARPVGQVRLPQVDRSSSPCISPHDLDPLD